MQVDKARLDEMLAGLGDDTFAGIVRKRTIPIPELRAILTKAVQMQNALDEITDLERHTRSGGPAPEDLEALSDGLSEAVTIEETALRSLRSTEGKEGECDPDGCKAHIEAFMNRSEAAEAHVAKLREALEGIDRLVADNIHDNGTEVDRMNIAGQWHTGPVVDASFRILRGFQKIARAALTRSPE